MQRLEIIEFGPIRTCRLQIKDFMVITGEQASGKSTIAKCVFYFNHLKEILSDMIQRNAGRSPLFKGMTLEEAFVREAKKIFIQSFGLENGSPDYSTIVYEYENGHSVVVHLEPREEQISKDEHVAI